MGNETMNYKFPKPEEDDFYDIKEYNKAMDILDETLTGMDNKKLDKNGDASETITELSQEVLHENLKSGEKLSVSLGKVKKFIEDTNGRYLKEDMTVYVATTGNDITGTGTAANPYRTINFALSMIPKNLNSHTITLNISGGTYVESVNIQNFLGGTIKINLTGDVTIQDWQVFNSYVACTTSGNVNTLTLSWIHLSDSANVYSSDVNFQLHATSSSAFSGTPSIFINDGSSFYMPGLTTLDSHSGTAVFMQHHARAYFGTIRGTGFDIGFSIYGGAIFTSVFNGLSAIQMYDIQNGGIATNSRGAIIGTLTQPAYYYVATTGSDITGNGSQANPFKTIQHAVDILPKDLGGYSATITIANGIYPENVNINGFHTGSINVTSMSTDVISSSVGINRIFVNKCDALISIKGIDVTNTTNSTAVHVENSYSVYLHYVRVASTANQIGIYAVTNNMLRIYYCNISNRDTAINVTDTNGYIWNCTGTNNNIGVVINGATTMHMIGTAPSATTARLRYSGAMFVEDSGTQISNIISSGLSCTWGTISGGYVRYGNLLGTAMVTINIEVTQTVDLTPGQAYSIHGFPVSAIPAISVDSHLKNVVHYCQLNDGRIVFEVSQLRTAGNHIIFSATYLTNS